MRRKCLWAQPSAKAERTVAPACGPERRATAAVFDIFVEFRDKVGAA
jgi:hypothetical protein